MYIDSWGFIVWDFFNCIAELTFIFGECNKASDNIRTFLTVPVPDTYSVVSRPRHSRIFRSDDPLKLKRCATSGALAKNC